MKVVCPQLKKKKYFSDKKNKSLMVTWNDSNNEKSSNSDDEQANISLMANTDEKVKVKTCSKSIPFLMSHQTMKKICPMMFFFKTVI